MERNVYEFFKVSVQLMFKLRKSVVVWLWYPLPEHVLIETFENDGHGSVMMIWK